MANRSAPTNDMAGDFARDLLLWCIIVNCVRSDVASKTAP
jgi:hypothetical protein